MFESASCTKFDLDQFRRAAASPVFLLEELFSAGGRDQQIEFLESDIDAQVRALCNLDLDLQVRKSIGDRILLSTAILSGLAKLSHGESP